MKYLGWFSCGSTSAVACKLAIDMYGKDNVDLWYIETGASHPDNARFLKQCQDWYGKEIKIAQSKKWKCPLDIAKKELFSTPYGSPCTKYLKKEVRQKQIMPLYDGEKVIHVFGFEYNLHEVNRALRWKEQQTKDVVFPLIEKRWNKQDCLLELKKHGIEMPTMYRLGYHNNNCIGCFKGGMGYWNKIRKNFPEVFNETSKVEQETHHTVLKKDGKPLYLAELKEDWGNHEDLKMPDCGLFCSLETVGLPVLEIEEAVKKLKEVK